MLKSRTTTTNSTNEGTTPTETVDRTKGKEPTEKGSARTETPKEDPTTGL